LDLIPNKNIIIYTISTKTPKPKTNTANTD